MLIEKGTDKAVYTLRLSIQDQAVFPGRAEVQLAPPQRTVLLSRDRPNLLKEWTGLPAFRFVKPAGNRCV